MPGWEETENEIRYRIRDPAQFASFFYKQLQRSPPVNAVLGVPHGQTASTIQAMRFPKANWTLDRAKAWFNQRKERLSKMAEEISAEFLQKGNLTIQALSFSDTEFTEESVKEWLVEKGHEKLIEHTGNHYNVILHPEDNFKDGTLRDIVMREGITSSVGMLKSDIQKSIAKKIPDRFSLSAEELNQLEDIDITEITLTRCPAVGKMAEFLVMKSADSGNYNQSVPICKIDDERKQVGGYLLVPDLPDFQGDMVTAKEIEKAQHNFMKNLAFRRQQGEATGLEHQAFSGIGYPIESFIDRWGVYGVKDGWFVTTQVTKSDVWQSIKRGEIVGYSVGGSGTRKKVNISIDAPAKVNKSADEEGIIRKFINLFRKEIEKETTPQIIQEEPPEEDVTEKKDNTQQEVNKVKIDEIKKFIAPQKAEEMEQSGVDLEKAYASFAEFTKAIGMNFTNSGIGYKMVMISDMIRGEIGAFPNADVGFGGNINKSADKQDKTQEQVQKNQEPNTADEIRAEMKKMYDQFEATMGKLGERLHTVENARGVRKSKSDVTFEPQTQDDDGDWDYYDSIDMPLKDAEKVAKSMGMD